MKKAKEGNKKMADSRSGSMHVELCDLGQVREPLLIANSSFTKCK